MYLFVVFFTAIETVVCHVNVKLFVNRGNNRTGIFFVRPNSGLAQYPYSDSC